MTLVLNSSSEQLCWPVTSTSLDALQTDYSLDDWVWSSHDKAPDVQLSSNHKAAYFYTDPLLDNIGTAGVRGSKGFLDGEHYWEITFLEPPIGTSVMVGVGTRHALLHNDNCQNVNLIGQDDQSWGLSYKGFTWHGGHKTPYCAPFYQPGTVIGVHLNLYQGTLSYYLNGQNLGVAFHGLGEVGSELYPIISSTAPSAELAVGLRKSRYLSLQEKCFLAISRQLRQKSDVENLPLPPIIKRHLSCLK